MAQTGCFTASGLCAIRASELDSTGARICPNVDGSAFDLSPVTFTATAEVSAGTTNEQRDGCGRICTTVTTADVTTGYSGSLEICKQDFELITVLANGSVTTIVNGTSQTIGFKQTADSGDPVEFNLWQEVYDGSARATGADAYLRHVFPSAVFSLTDFTLEAGPNTVTMNFTSSSTTGIGLGSFDDFADNLNSALYARWLEGTIPDAADAPYSANPVGCGFIDTPTCGS